MATKEDFRRPSVAQMRDTLAFKTVHTEHNLVQKLRDTNASDEGILVTSWLTPRKFFKGGTSSRAAKKHYYDPESAIAIKQPGTREGAYLVAAEERYPIANGIKSAFEEAFRGRRQEEITEIAYRMHPVQGNDRRWRMIHFDVPLAAVQHFSHSVLRNDPITLKVMAGADMAYLIGAKIECKVPSAQIGKKPYKFTVHNVPLHFDTGVAVVLGLRAGGPRDPERVMYGQNRYGTMESRMDPDVFSFDPHHVAAYFAIIKHYWNGKDHTAPFINCPFFIPSRSLFDFYMKLNRNLLIKDETLASKDKLRHPHIEESAMLVARAISIMGFPDSFWRPKRDGPIENYLRK